MGKKQNLFIINMSSPQLLCLVRKNSAGQEANFPIVERDIRVNYSTDAHTSTMPESVELSLYYCDVSFYFQRTK